MKAGIYSSFDTRGGASRAARRLCGALAETDVEARMHVAFKRSGDPRVRKMEGVSERMAKLRARLDNLAASLQRTDNPAKHSPAWFGSLKAEDINGSDYDLVNLHWLNDGYMSIEQIGRIRKPVVWTLHDMWAFCGAEHYVLAGFQERWKEGYTRDNRESEAGGLDINRWTWKRKRNAWNRPFHIVTPSRWLADCVSESKLLGAWPVSVIPNPLNTEFFRPQPLDKARKDLSLSKDKKLILFGAFGGISNPLKGWDLMEAALAKLERGDKDVECMVFGENKPFDLPELDMTFHTMGYIEDDEMLVSLYNAADVTVVPSRIENLPQSATEPQSCGCPVVAFRTGGLPDVVDHRRTGFLAEPFDSAELARGIEWILDDQERRRACSIRARERALARWTTEKVAEQYQSLYQTAAREQRESLI